MGGAQRAPDLSREGNGPAHLGRRILWGLLAAVMLAIGFTAVMAPRWGRAPADEPPMVLGRAPEFELSNRDGRRVSDRDLLGSPWVADFIFTRCAISCPRMTARMVQLASLLPSNAEISRVSFSVDPDYDTPEVLQTYARSWNIEDRRWLFLTGDRDQMKSIVTQGFKLAVEMNPPAGTFSPGEPILHSTRFVLVDAGGFIRGYYDVVQGGELERLARDIAALARARRGRGACGKASSIEIAERSQLLFDLRIELLAGPGALVRGEQSTVGVSLGQRRLSQEQSSQG